jgi:hypothetical protein
MSANAAVNPLFAVAFTTFCHALFTNVVDPKSNEMYSINPIRTHDPNIVACSAYPVVGLSASSRTIFMNSKSHPIPFASHSLGGSLDALDASIAQSRVFRALVRVSIARVPRPASPPTARMRPREVEVDRAVESSTRARRGARARRPSSARESESESACACARMSGSCARARVTVERGRARWTRRSRSARYSQRATRARRMIT